MKRRAWKKLLKLADQQRARDFKRWKGSHRRWAAIAKTPGLPVPIAVAYLLGENRIAMYLRRAASSGMLPKGIKL